MKEKIYEIYENKLSEQLSDDNPYKKKLIEMETPKTKSPIYSFLSIGLLIYCLIFAGNIIYNKAYGWEIVILSIITTVIGFIFLYKKTYIEKQNIKNKIIIIFCSIIYLIISSIVGFTAKEGIKYSELNMVFSFTNIDEQSYIALCIISSLTLGIILSYYSCPYEIYKKKYNNFINIKRNIKIEFRKIVKSNFYISILIITLLIISINLPLILFSFNIEAITISDIYKIIFFLSIIPIYITSSFNNYYYITIFDKSKNIKE